MSRFAHMIHDFETPMRRAMLGLLCSIFVAIGSHDAWGQFTDGLNVAFGKNRVQHRGFEWNYFEEGMFEVYHYREGDQIAGQVTRILSAEAKALAPMFGRSLAGPIQVLVFKSEEEFRQSNVGVMTSQDQETNIGGTAKLVGSKMFLYGRGDRLAMERDVREGLARILFNQTMYESQWTEALRNGNLVQVPAWMSEGAARYAGRGLDAASTARILDAAQTGQFERLDQATGSDAAVLGQAVWAYVADIYGLPTIANVLYMTRITRSPENGFRLATGSYLADLALEVRDHHLRRAPTGHDLHLPAFESKKALRQARRTAGAEIPLRLKRRYQYTQFVPSPDRSQWAFTTNERGQLRVGTVDVTSGKLTWHAVLGHRLARLEDDDPPRLAWHPQGKSLAFTTELKGAPRLGFINMLTGEMQLKELFKIDQVLDMVYAPDGAHILMSALEDGQSDLHLYDIVANNQKPLWRDRFDDLMPAFWPDQNTFIFASNRPDDTLRNDQLDHPFPANLDLYVANLDDDPIQLERWTHTPEVDERQPQPRAKGEFTYLVNAEGRGSRLGLGWRDSTIVAVDTVVRYRTFSQLREALVLPVPCTQLTVEDKNVLVSIRRAGQTNLLALPLPNLQLLHTPSAQQGFIAQTPSPFPSTLPDWSYDWAPDQIDFRNYLFETEKQRPAPQDTAANEEATAPKSWARLVPRNYRLNYALDKVQTQLNNTFNTSFYQPYNGQVNAQPGLGNATEIRLSDVMDDKHLIGGYTIPVNLSNTFFGLAYLNLEGQVDKELSFQRQSSARIDPTTGRLVETATHLLRREWRWAFDEVRSLRWGLAARFNRDVIQGTDLFSLTADNNTGEQLGLQVAWVHDDTRSPRLNIHHGFRARVWAEYFIDGVGTATAENGAQGLATPNAGWSFGTIGFDARRYIPLVGPSILALRMAGDWSIGQKKLLHMLGGTDNSFSLAGNANTAVDPDIPYTYQARITPLRGFQNNVRNGANMTVANAEVRFPIFFNSAGKTDFLKHLQAVAFADVGAAWTGLHPYTDDNTFNFVTVESNPITVTVSNNREPVLYDLGFGLRSRFLGYWLAADWAYGVDDGITLPRRFTLSLNFDF